MKRKSAFIFVVTLILFVFLFSAFANVQATDSASSGSAATTAANVGQNLDTQIPGLPSGIGFNQIEAANNKIINISSNAGYLGQQWKQIILQNPVTRWINGALTTISPFFKVVMAQDYSFSISFLITFVLWLFFFLSFNKIFKDYTSFSSWIALGIAFLVTVVMAQTTLLGKMSNFIVWVIFGVGKSWWVQILLGIGCGLALALIFLLIASFGKAIAKKRQDKKDYENRLKLESGAKSGEALTKAMSIFKRK